MQNRADASAESVQEYFLRNMAISFTDYIITELYKYTFYSSFSHIFLQLRGRVLFRKWVSNSPRILIYIIM